MSGTVGRRLLRRIMAVLPPVFLVLAAVFCWRLGVNQAHGLRRHADLVSFREAATLTAGDYGAMAKWEAEADTPLTFALWSQLENQRITAAFGGRSATVSVLAVRGDSRLVLPAIATVGPEDPFGCLVDKATAVTLLGASDAVGGVVDYGGREYIVRGVVDVPAPTLLLQAPMDSGLVLANVTAEGENAVVDFPLRHGLEPSLVIRYESFARMAGAFSALPTVTAALMLVLSLGRQVGRQRAYPLRQGAAFFALCAAATFLLLAALSAVPAEYVPTRWSDFAFWPEMLTQWRTAVLELFAAAKLRPELCMLASVGKSCWGLASSALLLAANAARQASAMESWQ